MRLQCPNTFFVITVCIVFSVPKKKKKKNSLNIQIHPLYTCISSFTLLQCLTFFNSMFDLFSSVENNRIYLEEYSHTMKISGGSNKNKTKLLNCTNVTQSMGIFPFQNNIILGNFLTLSLKEHESLEGQCLEQSQSFSGS